MNKIEKQLIRGLKWFTRKIKSGKPIKATRVERYNTPDGPMHVRRKVLLTFALLLTASLCQAAEPRVAYSLHCYAAGTSEAIPSVKAGQEFDLALVVQDLRPEIDGMFRGVFATYCNATFATRYAAPQNVAYSAEFANGRHCFTNAYGLARWGAFTNGQPGDTEVHEVSRVRMKAQWPPAVAPSISQATVFFRINFNNLQSPADNTLVLGTLKTASPAVYFPGEEPAVWVDQIETSGATLRVVK